MTAVVEITFGLFWSEIVRLQLRSRRLFDYNTRIIKFTIWRLNISCDCLQIAFYSFHSFLSMLIHLSNWHLLELLLNLSCLLIWEYILFICRTLRNFFWTVLLNERVFVFFNIIDIRIWYVCKTTLCVV
jgi:hypothetical protein